MNKDCRSKLWTRYSWPSASAFYSNLRTGIRMNREKTQRNCKRKKDPSQWANIASLILGKERETKNYPSLISQQVAIGYVPYAHSHLLQMNGDTQEGLLLALPWGGLLGKLPHLVDVLGSSAHFPLRSGSCRGKSDSETRKREDMHSIKVQARALGNPRK